MTANDPRPDPDALLAEVLREEAEMKQGKLFIFLGMCPGVGKTYAMLKAARQRKIDGVDVLVGVVETHGRSETAELLDGLEVLPRKSFEHRGHVLQEFDLDVVLLRKPALVLVDELAHTNVPGSRHAKRHQDVLELIAAGIDVFTTVNVQHIESQVDTVKQITGVTITETVPDSILDYAHEIEVIDLSVEKLLDRMSAGKVYLGERAELAATNFFKEGNLTALREMALRFTAEHVDRDLEEIRRSKRISSPWQANARLLVGVGPSPYAESLIRWTRRAATRLGCQWLAVWVEGSQRPTPEQQERLALCLGLARKLGAEVVSVTGEEVATALLEVARERNVTQIVVGKPDRRSWLRRSLAERIVDASGEIDVCVVRPVLATAMRKSPPRRTPSGYSGIIRDYLWIAGITFGLVAAGWVILPETGYPFIGMMFLLAVIFSGLKFSRGPVLAMAALSAMSWNYFFIRPRFTLHISKLEDMLMFGMFFIVAVSMGHLTTRLRQRERAERDRQRQTAALLRVTQSAALSAELDKGLQDALRTIGDLLHAETALFVRNIDRSLPASPHPASTFTPTPKEWGVINWTYQNKAAAGRFTDTLPESAATWFPLQTASAVMGVLGIRLGNDDLLDFRTRQSVEAFALQLALVLEKEHFVQAITQAELLAQSERLQRTLLDSVSHELKTPLAVIQASLEGLPGNDNPYLAEIHTASQRLQRVVNHLLQMTRIESSSVQSAGEWCLPGDIIHQAVGLAGDELDAHPLAIHVPDDLPPVRTDPNLLSQAMANILHNAAIYTPQGTAIQVSGAMDGPGVLVFRILDDGPGLPEGDEEKVFRKFYRPQGSPAGGTGLGLSITRALVKALGGDVKAGNPTGGGAEFTIRLPVETLPS
ncbi:sensor histidine kinase KdpD [Luteolibacter sp. SL250]|uniref:sensor histidine kinase n=1 Tax=Luteolibacter sp. SL250 TaxID=2995170 RepID=UPI0022721BC1|nr:sensor histidine kinase KdpD [Luteolibacter sp. SL250]WAC19554.1 sensor histidine kinase KdpD [Luteolibacter sp. SL250]